MKFPFRMSLRILVFLFISFISTHSYSQIKNKGTPFIRNYTPKDMGVLPENWSIKQDQRSITYVGNKEGLLEYDGTYWKKHLVSNKTIVRSLDIDKRGNIFVGAQGELGYFSPDKSGNLKYHSILHLLPPDERNIVNDVWSTFVFEDKVVYRNYGVVIVLKPDSSIKIFHCSKSFTTAASIDGNFYVWDVGYGLFKLESNELKPVYKEVPGQFNVFRSILPLEDQGFLFLGNEGCFMLNNNTLKLFNTPVNEFIHNHKLFTASSIGNNYFAILSLQNGLVIMDKKGRPIQHLNIENGLQTNSPLCVYYDNFEGLWIGSSVGVDYVEINSPFSILNDKKSVQGTPYAALIYNKELYLGTNQGVYYRSWDDYENPLDTRYDFTQVKNSLGQVYALSELDHTLFCGHHEGPAVIKNHVFSLLSAKRIDNTGCWNFLPLIKNPKYILSGNYFGLYLLEKKKEWSLMKSLKNFSESSRFLSQEKDGTIWVGHGYKGIYKIMLNQTGDSITSVKRYDSSFGISSDINYAVFKVKDETVFCGDEGIFKYDAEKDKFIPHPVFAPLFGNKTSIRKIVEDKKGNLWYATSEEMGILVLQKDGSYRPYTRPFKKLSGSLISSFELFTPIDEENIILGTQSNFVHYDPTIYKNYLPFGVNIREVINTGTTDSLVFGGAFCSHNGYITTDQPASEIRTFPYSNNNFRFSFSAAFYEDNEKTEYQYCLKGYDKWTNWTKSTLKEYTNLPEGTYTFMVKARNIYDVESNVSTYTFRISAPWYRTIWAYLLYAVLFVGIVYSSIQISLHRLKRHNEKLEGLVKERTRFIVQQKEEIENQKKEITDSINYSKRIQLAILPDQQEIKTELPQSFIFYKPKDIVSGDFYWYNKKNDKEGNKIHLIAAADCTGHGVPGAFMSMIGVEKLNDIVNHTTEPGKILRELNILIKKTLHQSSSDEATRDGMDIALCAIDPQNKTISFAGANRPAWLVRKNNPKEIEEYKSTKLAIGGLTDDKQIFDTVQLSYSEGDTLYIFTDGYIDQFGGAMGRKLMSKNFKSLILSLQDKTLKEQESYLIDFFENWKGDKEQVDDVLIIGIKF